MKENRQKEIPIKKTDVKKTVVNYLLITVASAVYSVAVSLFLDPNSLAPGGVTGIAIILNRLIPVETGTLILLINIPILILGAWKFGLRFSLSTIYCTVVISLFTNLLSGVKTATADPLLAALAGGSLAAVGIGWVFKAGATTGGTDIIIKLLRSKMPHLRTGGLFLAMDAVIVAVSGFVFKNTDVALYAGLTVFIISCSLSACCSDSCARLIIRSTLSRAFTNFSTSRSLVSYSCRALSQRRIRSCTPCLLMPLSWAISPRDRSLHTASS